MAGFVTLAARWRTQGVGVGQRRRHEGFEYRTSAPCEGIEATETFFAKHRTAIFVEDGDCATADLEAPFASDAIVEPRGPPKHFTMTVRSNQEVVFEPSCTMRTREFAPEAHVTSLRSRDQSHG